VCMRDQVEISGTRYSVAERIAVGELRLLIFLMSRKSD
jgi:hypothetical protein